MFVAHLLNSLANLSTHPKVLESLLFLKLNDLLINHKSLLLLRLFLGNSFSLVFGDKPLHDIFFGRVHLIK
jgi:hypothetical protein